MTYQIIPNPNDLISVSQGQLKDNFQANKNTFDVDHVDFNATGAGRHKFVTINDVSVDPALTYPQSQIYEKNFGTAPNRDTELYFASPRENNAAQLNRYLPTAKAIFKFKPTGAAGVQNAVLIPNTLNFNVSVGGITATAPAPFTFISTFTVLFTNALDYDTYFVFISMYTGNYLPIATQTVSGFTFSAVNSTTFTFGFMVI